MLWSMLFIRAVKPSTLYSCIFTNVSSTYLSHIEGGLGADDNAAALDISTGPLARRTFQTAGPVRASTIYLSLACTGHLDICRAIRFQIVLARTITNHSMYFSRGRPSHISTVFVQSFCYSETPAWRESGMSIKHTDECLDHAARDTSMRISGRHPGTFLREAHGMVPSKQYCVWVMV